MDNEKRNIYANILLEAYNKNLVKILWSASGASLGINDKNEDLISEFNDEGFINFSFSVIQRVISIAEGKILPDDESITNETARKIYEKEHDLENHLYIKKNNVADSFKRMEYEIVSHRNSDKPDIIEANSAIIKIISEKDDDEITHVFEVSKRDIRDIVDIFTELNDKMNTI